MMVNDYNCLLSYSLSLSPFILQVMINKR